MTVQFESGYTLPSGDQPLTHARIAHSLNWLSGGTATANSTATGYYADAPTNTLTYERWKPATNPSAANIIWTYDHGSSEEVDYCAIAAHTLGTNGCSIAVQYWNGSTWVAITSATAVTSDEPLMVIFEPRTGTQFRFILTTGSAPEVGVVKFGSSMQMERPIYGGHAPIPMARQTILRSNYSETGEYLGRVKQRTYLATEYSWQNLTADWVRVNWPSFQLATEAEPFWIAWRPETFGDVGFCQLDQVPVPQNMGIRDLMSVSMSARARGYN